MPPTRTPRSTDPWIALGPAIAGVIGALGETFRGFEQIGIHQLVWQVAVIVAIGALVAAVQMRQRWRHLTGLLLVTPEPICRIRRELLGVERSGVAAELVPERQRRLLPPYVERDVDPELRRLIDDPEQRCFLLVGNEGSGKTRTAYQRAVERHGSAIVLVPRKPVLNADGTAAEEPLQELLRARLPPLWARQGCLLWLDDLGAYLTGSSVEPALLQAWLDGHPKRRIIATIRSGDQQRYTTAAGAAGVRARGIVSAGHRERLKTAWSASERKRARASYPRATEEQLAELSVHLSSVPALRERCQDAEEACPEGAIVLRSAVAWRRAGLESPIPEQTLLALFAARVDNVPPGTDMQAMFAKGVAWAAARTTAVRPLLRRVKDDPPEYVVDPVAVEHFAHEDGPLPVATWELLLDQLVWPDDRLALGVAAYHDGRLAIAERAASSVMDVPSDAKLHERARMLFEAVRGTRHVAAGPATPLDLAAERGAPASPEAAAAARSTKRRRDAAGRRRRRPGNLLAAIDNGIVSKASIRVLSLLAIDVVGLWAALLLAYVVQYAITHSPGDAVADTSLAYFRRQVDLRIAIVVLLVVLLFVLGGLYRARSRRANYALLLAGLTGATFAFLLVRAFAGGRIAPAGVILLALPFAWGFVGTGRVLHMLLARWIYVRAWGQPPQQALVGTAADVAHAHATLGARRRSHALVGWIDVGQAAGAVPELTRLGTIDALKALVVEHDLDDLVICGTTLSDEQVERIVDTAWIEGAQVRALSQSKSFLVGASRYVPGEPLPLEQLRLPEFDPTQWALKRIFDLVAGSALLVVSAVVWIPAAILIKTTSRGPLFQRVSLLGYGGKAIPVRKFRTTHQRAAGVRGTYQTSIGRQLDRYAIDELPQLLTVLRGHMSLVGPRPISAKDIDRLAEWEYRRFYVQPGITGLWQISGRHDTDYADMVRLDLYYVQRWSLFLDLEILIKTLPVSLRGRRAVLIQPTDDGAEA